MRATDKGVTSHEHHDHQSMHTAIEPVAPTKFTAEGERPPVGKTETAAQAASASDLAYGEATSGGAKGAAGAAGGDGKGDGESAAIDGADSKTEVAAQAAGGGAAESRGAETAASGADSKTEVAAQAAAGGGGAESRGAETEAGGGADSKTEVAAQAAAGGGVTESRGTETAADGKSGAPLPAHVRGKFERSLGADLSNVRVHADSDQAQGAKAVTVGNDIHVAPGHYDPKGKQGEELLAHEVAHTVQQKHATPQLQAKAEQPVSASHGAEADADQAASAMVAGDKASVKPVAQQAPHAKDAAWMAPIRASLKSGDWSDVALRLNGLAIDDIYTTVKGFTLGQRNHVRGAAQVVMAGWPEHVTEQIEKVAHEQGETGNKAAADYYAGYERAIAAAKAKTGSWSEVVTFLAGMSAWDQDDRLKKLDWFELEALRGATDNKTLLAAIDKADVARAKAVLDAYEREVGAGQWAAACAHLTGMSSVDIIAKLSALPYTSLLALQPFAHGGLVAPVQAEINRRPKGEKDPTKPTQVDGPVDVVAPLLALPDFSDDTRTTQQAHDAGGDWSGSAKLQSFVEQLALTYAEHKADQQTKPPADRAAFVEKERSETLTKFKNQWHRVINEYPITAKNDSRWASFATVARYWCSDISQGRLFALDAKAGDYSMKAKMATDAIIKDDPAKLESVLKPMLKGSGPPVRPILNDFIRDFPDNPKVNLFYNYPNHGGGDLAGQGYSVDLMFDYGNSAAGRNDEGFVPREIALQVIHNIAHTAKVVHGDWQVCYNDYSVAKAASAFYGNRVSHVGVNSGADDPKKKGNENGHGTHAPLNLHFHVDVVPLKPELITDDEVGKPPPSPVGTTVNDGPG